MSSYLFCSLYTLRVWRCLLYVSTEFKLNTNTTSLKFYSTIVFLTNPQLFWKFQVRPTGTVMSFPCRGEGSSVYQFFFFGNLPMSVCSICFVDSVSRNLDSFTLLRIGSLISIFVLDLSCSFIYRLYKFLEFFLYRRYFDSLTLFLGFPLGSLRIVIIFIFTSFLSKFIIWCVNFSFFNRLIFSLVFF